MNRLDELVRAVCQNGVNHIAIGQLIKQKRIIMIAPSIKIKRNVLFCFSTVFANGIKAHNIAKAPVTVSLRERRLQVLFLFRCCL